MQLGRHVDHCLGESPLLGPTLHMTGRLGLSCPPSPQSETPQYGFGSKWSNTNPGFHLGVLNIHCSCSTVFFSARNFATCGRKLVDARHVLFCIASAMMCQWPVKRMAGERWPKDGEYRVWDFLWTDQKVQRLAAKETSQRRLSSWTLSMPCIVACPACGALSPKRNWLRVVVSTIARSFWSAYLDFLC